MNDRLDWTQIPGWTCPQLLAFYEAAAGWLQPGDTVVEAGVAYGRSLAYLAGLVKPGVRLVGVDLWDEFMGGDNLDPAVYAGLLEHGTPMGACDAMLARCGVQADLMRRSSVHASQAFADGSVAMVFLDDRHEYDYVKAGIHAWLPKLRPGGVLAGHDINANFPGVGWAVHEALGSSRRVAVRQNPDGWGGVWAWSKPLAPGPDLGDAKDDAWSGQVLPKLHEDDKR